MSELTFFPTNLLIGSHKSDMPQDIQTRQQEGAKKLKFLTKEKGVACMGRLLVACCLLLVGHYS